MAEPSPEINLPADRVAGYLDRIGLAGAAGTPLDASPATLAAIVEHHTRTIAFENLTPLTGEPVRLGPDELHAKLVTQRRGGYCFEHNLLVHDVLVTLGFDVGLLAARVTWNRPDGAITARDHLLLRVDLPDGVRIVDCGFGGLTLTGVLRLDTDDAQDTPHERFRLVRTPSRGDAGGAGDGSGDRFELQAELPTPPGPSWRSLYRFDLQPQHRIDAEMASWYTATHPDSPFVANLLVARPDTDRRYALRNGTRTVHHRDGTVEQQRLTDVPAIEASLERDFLLDLSGVTGLRDALRRFV